MAGKETPVLVIDRISRHRSDAIRSIYELRDREVKLGSPTGSEKERGAVMTVMTMEETILQTFVGRTYLGGPSANPFWNVPFSLKSLCGEIEAAQFLIQAHAPLLEQRLADNEEMLTELGLATTCVVTTSLIAEKAIKTLVAQTKHREKPWSPRLLPGLKGHDLAALFRQRLNPTDQDAVQHQLETLPAFWNHYAETRSLEEILDIASNNFDDWRYAMEGGSPTGGIPKPLLKVSVAFTLVGINRLTQWQAMQSRVKD